MNRAFSASPGNHIRPGALPQARQVNTRLRRSQSGHSPLVSQFHVSPESVRGCPTIVHPAIWFPMSTRVVIRVFVALLLASFASLRAQEHPRAPQQSQSQQLPQTTKGAPQAAMMQASMSEVSDGLKRFISGYAAKSADKKFHVPYQRKNLALDLVRVHDDRFSSLGGDKYFACVDMKGADAKIYDIDFFMVVQTGKLTVTETSVHKINGKALYNWRQEGGVWKKVKVS
jgi:hypothetical protein